MAAYEIYLKESVWKDLRKIEKADLKRILSGIDKLGAEPRPAGCEKLSGQSFYRVRQGKYRIVYSIQAPGMTIWTIKVGHRKRIYH